MRARILIALVLVGALAGCQESGFDESRETQRPLKVQHALDPLTGTKVPGQAERPATLTADALGDTLALGVEPVATARAPAYMRDEARGIETVSDTDLAAIEAADPDLILGSKEGQGDEYDELTAIAPTVMSDGDDWKLTLRLHGEALGRTNDAEKLLIDWDNRVAKVKDAIGSRKVRVVLVGPNDAPVPPGAVGRLVLADLGIGTGGGTVLRIPAGPEWTDGGLLGARAALQDVERAL
ncbi:MAG TPA: ABC transporter substrate-binding protein [Thermoleophilaceae bacterium]